MVTSSHFPQSSFVQEESEGILKVKEAERPWSRRDVNLLPTGEEKLDDLDLDLLRLKMESVLLGNRRWPYWDIREEGSHQVCPSKLTVISRTTLEACWLKHRGRNKGRSWYTRKRSMQESERLSCNQATSQETIDGFYLSSIKSREQRRTIHR